MEGSLQDLYGMLEQLEYVNHLGERLRFGRDGLYVNENDLRDFSWNVLSTNDQISGFSRGVQKKTIPVRVACVDQTDGVIKKNRLFEIPEKDVLSAQRGKLWINGYYCECFITSSKKTRYSVEDRFLACNIEITTDRPVWVKETKLSYGVVENYDTQPSEYLDTPFDAPFGLKRYIDRIVPLVVDGVFSSNFRLDIHGEAINPTVYINERMYQVNTTVPEGSTLTVDLLSKSIYLTYQDGTAENRFDARNRENYIFEPVAVGEVDVRWDNFFAFDLTLYDERSEPKWEVTEEIK